MKTLTLSFLLFLTACGQKPRMRSVCVGFTGADCDFTIPWGDDPCAAVETAFKLIPEGGRVRFGNQAIYACGTVRTQ